MSFGVTGTVNSPSFSIYNSAGILIATSELWSDPNLSPGFSTVFSITGAFALQAGSNEAALFLPLSPGAYTAIFRAASAGTILAEVYVLPY